MIKDTLKLIRRFRATELVRPIAANLTRGCQAAILLLERLAIDIRYCWRGNLEVLVGLLGNVNVALEQVGYLLLLALIFRFVSHDHYHAGSLGCQGLGCGAGRGAPQGGSWCLNASIFICIGHLSNCVNRSCCSLAWVNYLRHEHAWTIGSLICDEQLLVNRPVLVHRAAGCR